MDHYDVGLVCIDGHVVNDAAESYPQHNQPFCSKCGKSAIRECPSCGIPIRGYYHADGVISVSRWEAPGFCHACGKPYPWTQRREEALREVVEELDGLSDEERSRLRLSIPDILQETPKSGTAVLRFKKAVGKAGAVGSKILTDVLAKVAAEAVKKSMGL